MKPVTYETAVPVAQRRPMFLARRISRRLGSRLLLGALALCLSTTAPAASEPLEAPHEQLYAVDALADGSGMTAVGTFGAAYHSSDGGKSWTAQNTGVLDPLFGVALVDSRHAVVVGKSGVALWTADGGTTWQRSKTGTTKHLFDVAMTDAERGFAVGDWGVVLATSDGGATWTDHSLDADVVLAAITFSDAHHGWIVGEFGTILATADGGHTWEPQQAGTEKTLFDVAFLDEHSGWAVGIDGIVLRTRDGGTTWEVQRGAASAESLDDLAFQDLLTNPGLYSIAMAGRTGYIVGDTGTVLVSTDRGETWAPRILPEDVRLLWLRGAAVIPDGLGTLVGAKGLVVRMADGELSEPAVGMQYAAGDVR